VSPTTKAGQELLDAEFASSMRREGGTVMMRGFLWEAYDLRVAAIAAIEAEAHAQGRAEALAEISAAVRDVPAVHIVNTEYVPTFKRRPDQCIDRAAVLAVIAKAARP
jgi:hypothetical protein